MKVILLQDVAKVGKKMDIKEVSRGYALNALIPQKKAKEATDQAIKEAEAQKVKEESLKKIHEDLLLKNLKGLQGAKLEISEKANEKGHLFAAIHEAEIVKIIKDSLHIDVLPDHIKLDKPIKETGEHNITVSVQDKKVDFILNVRGIE